LLQAKLVEKRRFIWEEVPIPEPKYNEVIVKVHRVGICGSDSHLFNGKAFFSPPIVLGHEVSGEIYYKGKGVKDLEVGERVTFVPSITCGVCEYCKQNKRNLCESLTTIGDRSFGGGFSEYVAVPAQNILMLPSNVSYSVGALIEPASVAMHAIKVSNIIKLGRAQKVLVFGVGTIGLITIQILRWLEVQDILAVDIVDWKLSKAKEFGASRTLNLNKEKVEKKLRVRKVGEEGALKSGDFDIVFDYACCSDSINLSLQNLKKNGKIIVVGIPTDMTNITFLSFYLLVVNEFKILGSNMYLKEDFHEVLSLIKKEKLFLNDFVSQKFKLPNIQDAFEEYERKKDKWLKVQIVCS